MCISLLFFSLTIWIVEIETPIHINLRVSRHDVEFVETLGDGWKGIKNPVTFYAPLLRLTREGSDNTLLPRHQLL